MRRTVAQEVWWQERAAAKEWGQGRGLCAGGTQGTGELGQRQKEIMQGLGGRGKGSAFYPESGQGTFLAGFEVGGDMDVNEQGPLSQAIGITLHPPLPRSGFSEPTW